MCEREGKVEQTGARPAAHYLLAPSGGQDAANGLFHAKRPSVGVFEWFIAIKWIA